MKIGDKFLVTDTEQYAAYAKYCNDEKNHATFKIVGGMVVIVDTSPTEQETDEQRILEIDTKLIEIDGKSIRDLRNFVVGLISKVSTIKITEPIKAIKTFFDIIAELGGQSGHLEQFDIDAANLRKERQELWNKWHKGV